jgi:hypothetical protein
MQGLEQIFKSLKTHPNIFRIVLRYLNAWFYGTSGNTAPPLLRSVIEDQNNIGQASFIGRLWSNKWLEIQAQYYCLLGRRNMGMIYAIAIIKRLIGIFWDMWDHHNQVLCSLSNPYTIKGLTILDIANLHELYIGKSNLDSTVRNFLFTLVKLFRKSTPFKHNWLQSIELVCQLGFVNPLVAVGLALERALIYKQ